MERHFSAKNENLLISDSRNINFPLGYWVVLKLTEVKMLQYSRHWLRSLINSLKDVIISRTLSIKELVCLFSRALELALRPFSLRAQMRLEIVRVKYLYILFDETKSIS